VRNVGFLTETLQETIDRNVEDRTCLVACALCALPAWSQQKPAELADSSLEDLMNIQVTSVSKKEQKLSQVAAAIFVITLLLLTARSQKDDLVRGARVWRG
jgi:hypothetical protein